MENYSEDQLEAYKSVLKTKDKDGSGDIDKEEFKACLPLLGVFTTEQDANFLAKHFDNNRDGQLKISEILENMHILYEHSLKGDDLKSAFEIIDRNHNGCISQQELLTILLHDNFMTVPEARHLIRILVDKYDNDGDGKFNYAEFIDIFNSPEFAKVIEELLGAQ